ncbi:hypothetical protein DUT90_07470 [Polaribacter sp. WD7]|uniref:hypothetical protein n=1 Tax=Polaribacter sp. WD7 TaxID=2269061 RepID=UPI000DF3288F|nr:hypothetical protein [Polaribacter sp. WD7]RCS26946.1 hypothetical protein DUT90_07470 [Polaribacter sp. WD7]
MMILRFVKYTPLLLLFLLISSCDKTDWSENFKEKQKSPFGNYIVYNEASSLFKTNSVTLLEKNIYDYLLLGTFDDFSERKSYVCIKHSTNKLDAKGLDELLNFVAKGNQALLSLHHFKDSLKTKLEFTTNNLDKMVYNTSKLKKLNGNLYLNDSSFNKTSYTYNRNLRRHYFLQYNEQRTDVLGTIEIDGEKAPNFIRIAHGKGAFYLHAHPIAFTNYYLLNNNEDYVANVFSYLPNAPILWDPHIKSSKYQNDEDKKSSIFKFFLEHDSLTWFLYTSFIGLLLFMLFNARRKQRAIPVIEPLKNSTVAFAQTIANLYLKEENHKNIVDKKITYFLEKIRSKYLLDTSNLNTDFIEKLAAKSGNNLQPTKYLINTIIMLHKKDECSEEELIVLHKMIKNFFNKK